MNTGQLLFAQQVFVVAVGFVVVVVVVGFLPRVETRGIIEAKDSEPVTETKEYENQWKNRFEPFPLLQLLRIWAESDLQM